MRGRSAEPRVGLLARWRSCSPLFVLFLYGADVTIFVLSFQGPRAA